MNFPKQTFHLERGDLKFGWDKIMITVHCQKQPDQARFRNYKMGERKEFIENRLYLSK